VTFELLLDRLQTGTFRTSLVLPTSHHTSTRQGIPATPLHQLSLQDRLRSAPERQRTKAVLGWGSVLQGERPLNTRSPLLRRRI